MISWLPASSDTRMVSVISRRSHRTAGNRVSNNTRDGAVGQRAGVAEKIDGSISLVIEPTCRMPAHRAARGAGE